MSADAEGFLSRWAKRKASAKQAPRDERALSPPMTGAPDAPSRPEGAAAPSASDHPADAIDPSTLPPVESLSAESDYSVFLKSGVPTALRTLALRKLWTSDPTIASYKSLADYDWDFNAPGYGQLLPTDDVRSLADRIARATQDPDPTPSAADPMHVPQRSTDGDDGRDTSEPVADACSDASIEVAGERAPPPTESLTQTAGEAAGEASEVASPSVAIRSPTPPSVAEPPVRPARRHGGALPV